MQSNSLAVKILERISAYYYLGDWSISLHEASVVAHNISNRHDKTSTEFVGDLLGIKAHNYSKSDYKEILNLNEFDPHKAIYVSIAYGAVHRDGRIHGRHALRLKNMQKIDSSDKYRLELINPWNNEKTEELIVSEEELSNRNDI